MILAALVDWSALGKVVVYALVATVGMSTVFSFGIVGLVRFDDCRRGARSGGGIGYAALALTCGLIIAGVVVEAIIIMAKK
jgi:hypothetical protein